MKRIVLFLGLSVLSMGVYAQNMSDALNFIQSEQIGTARSLGMGNAMAAIGGDLGSIAINPAGSSATAYSQMAITMGSNISIATAQGTTLPGNTSPYCFDNRYRKSSSGFALPNFGINFNYETGRNYGVKAFSLAVLINVNNYSRDNLYTSGRHSGTSFAGAMASRASGIPYADLDGDKAYNYDWSSALAWRSGMISTAGSSAVDYVGATEKFIESEDGRTQYFTAGALNQEYGRRITGSRTDYIFNASMNISDLVYLGASIGVNSLSYNFDEYIKEAPVDMDEFDVDFGSEGSTYFKNLKYQDWYSASGTGVYLKLGFLATPGNFRIGAAVRTPDSMTIHEKWGSAAETHFVNNRFDGKASTPQGEYYYKLVSPWNITAGIAGTIAGMAVLSADYEADVNSTMRFREYYREDNFNDLNAYVERNAGNTHKLRAGLELKPLDWLSLRAGYNFSALCLGMAKNSDLDKSLALSHAATAGIGFSTNGAFYFDLACKALFRPAEYIYPYADYDKADNGSILHFSPEILNRRQLLTAVMTVGFRF